MPGEHTLGENLPPSNSPQLQQSTGVALPQVNNNVVNNPSVTPNLSPSLEEQNRTFGDQLSYGRQHFSLPAPPPTPVSRNNSSSQPGRKL